MNRETILELIRATAHRYGNWWILPPGDTRSAELYRLYASALTETMDAIFAPSVPPSRYPFTEGGHRGPSAPAPLMPATDKPITCVPSLHCNE